MSAGFVLILLLALGALSWWMARSRAQALYAGRGSLKAMPNYHGWHMALWTLVPALVGWLAWNAAAPGMIHAAILADPANHLHLYGKAEVRKGRKMGHVTRLARD